MTKLQFCQWKQINSGTFLNVVDQALIKPMITLRNRSDYDEYRFGLVME